MNEISSFPVVPQLPYPKELAPKKKGSKIDWAFGKLGKYADSEPLKAAHFIGELLSNVFSHLKSLAPKKESAPAGHNANIAGTVFDVLGLFRALESVATIAQNLRKKGLKGIDKSVSRLEIAQAFVDIIGGVGSFLGIFERFRVFELAKITEAMGKIPTIGQAVSAALPVSTVFSLFSIVSSEISIIISALKIKKMVGKVNRATHKIKGKWSQPIDAAFSKNRVSNITKKQETCLENGEKLKVELDKMGACVHTKKEDFETKQAAYLKLKEEVKSANKVSQVFRKIAPKGDMKKAKGAYKRKIKKYQKMHDQLQALQKTHELQGEKIQKWKAIQNKCEAKTLTESEKKALETMRMAKIKKWKAKRVNEYWDIAHEVTKIALAAIAIAVSIASIGVTLAFTGGNVPVAALIALATIGLSLTASHLVRSLFFNRVKKKAPQAVKVPVCP